MFDIEKILKALSEEEFADLFFEETRSVVIVCEEDRIEKSHFWPGYWVGLRILVGGRTIYSFTNQVTEEASLTGQDIEPCGQGEGRRKSDRSPLSLGPPRSLAFERSPGPLDRRRFLW
jgi:hypothetical protein